MKTETVSRNGTRILLSIVLVVAMISSVCACSVVDSGRVIINDDFSDDNEIAKKQETLSDYGLNDPVQPEKGFYSNVAYCVGSDIPEGGYVIDCTGTDQLMRVLVFANEADYEEFSKTNKSTYGELREAIELYAWADFYLELNEKAYIGLRKNFVILLDDGLCEFNKYKQSVSGLLYPGIYVVGEDIESEKLNILCTTEFMRVSLFSDKDSYVAFHRTSRFTYGEVSDALAAYSDSSDFLCSGESTFTNLQKDMILVVEDGVGECSISEGPIIN